MSKIQSLLGDEAESLLTHQCRTINREEIYLPGPDFVGRVMSQSDRKASVLRNMQTLCNHGRLAGTGYLSLLPVDQGVEHSGGCGG